MNKKIIIGSVIGLGVLIILIVANLNSPKSEATTGGQSQNQESSQKQSVDKVQVFLFHATQRCTTCIAIGRLAGETVDEYFQPELRDGKIEFREINIDLPENKELAQKFQASGSSLFINAIYNGQDSINEDTQVWRLTQNEVQFKSYLKGKLDNLLGK
ncbi:MAG: nitrophenyl compound nitroreductase subunit ArsF family protein [Candidatus Gribaldobacteria bacterium]|nr:nitrophenyl compound nitroreductase subunit ArsF family protein [Candidatus Gribaldobacteria bacterium]